MFNTIESTIVKLKDKITVLFRDNPRHKSAKVFPNPVYNLTEATGEKVKEFLNSFDTVLADCDGVLWHDWVPVAGSPATLNYFRKLGKTIFFVTNNSTRLRSELSEKANKLGYEASPEEFFSTAYLTAHYMNSINFKKKVYLIGSPAMAQELSDMGIESIGVGPDPIKPDFRNMKQEDLDKNIGAVVLGYDPHISYAKIMKAASYLVSKDCLFVGTNPDETSPSLNDGIIIPSVGPFIQALESVSGRKALVIGKPYGYAAKVLESYNLKADRTLMIGDRINTDVEFGFRNGYQTLLVLTGVTTQEDLKDIKLKQIQPMPDVVVPKLGDILQLAQSYKGCE